MNYLLNFNWLKVSLWLIPEKNYSFLDFYNNSNSKYFKNSFNLSWWDFINSINDNFYFLQQNYLDFPIFVLFGGLFLSSSLVSLLSDNKTSGNIIVAPFSSGSLIIVIGFWFLLSLALPYLAKSEEKSFRSLVFGTKNRIITSIKFGLIHMIGGVPLIVALVLSVIGYIYSIFYVTAFNKAIKVNPNTADEVVADTHYCTRAAY